MKTISSPTCGASSKILRTFYISYIRAKIDYGAVLYSTAAKTNLGRLDKIQNACIRLILAARKLTPIISLEAEAHIASLNMRRVYLRANSLINFTYKAKGKSVLDPVGNNKNNSDVDYSVNSFMRRALLYNWIFYLNIKRVYENNVYSMPPWTENVQVIFRYDESAIYNNQTVLEYLDMEFSNYYKYCCTDG